MRKAKMYGLGLLTAASWLAALACGDGIEQAATGGEMMLYALACIVLFGIGFIPAALSVRLMQEEEYEKDARRVHKPHARPYKSSERWGA